MRQIQAELEPDRYGNGECQIAQCDFCDFLASSSEAVGSAARGGALLLDHYLRRLHQAYGIHIRLKM